jgi:hypothetical protein
MCITIFCSGVFIVSMSALSRSFAALFDWTARVLGHRKELFRKIMTLVSVNVRAGWMNPCTVSLLLLTEKVTVTQNPRKERRFSLKSDKEWEALTPMMQSPLFVRCDSVVISIVVGWVAVMFSWPYAVMRMGDDWYKDLNFLLSQKEYDPAGFER